MKVIVYITIYLFLFSEYAEAQQLQGKVLAPLPQKTNGMTVVDSCNIRILYALNADDINNPNTYVDLQRLEIGNHVSKYYSHFIFNNDSLCTEWATKYSYYKSVPSYLGPLGKKKYRWSEYKYSEYFKDHQTKTLTEYSRMPHLVRPNYKYSEHMPIQEWKIQNDTLSVNGFLCQKAICHFRGRDYIAWFTTDIPINAGPWKFSGLPGLILKIYDTKHIYTFECVKIENGKFAIRKYNFTNYKSIERKKLLKLQKKLNENYFGIVGGEMPNGGKMPDPISYEPLELE
ncbi:GLPGLI family protein [Bacteroides timonensis]|uniref:GLPGLI family protein n=1 Tax=Bacteroides timonensis TaxID=1470345 RepID=UPI0005C58C1A|nr:GLPGLI family protein [Bacteroides timonensis]